MSKKGVKTGRKISSEIGPECSGATIDRKLLEKVCETAELPDGFEKVILSNGMILELDEIRVQIGKTWKC